MRPLLIVVLMLSCLFGSLRLGAQDAPLFEDVTEASGLPMAAPCKRVAFSELNGDGVPDVILDRTGIWLSQRSAKGAAGRRFVPSKVAFQEELISTLKEALDEHGVLIDAMSRQLKQMNERLSALDPSQVIDEADEVPPPHY